MRAIGDASERFREDGLRPLRACRFAAQLASRVDEATLAAIPGSLDILAKVSAGAGARRDPQDPPGARPLRRASR